MAKMFSLVTLGLLLAIGWINAGPGEEGSLQLQEDLEPFRNQVGGEVLSRQLRHVKNNIRNKRKSEEKMKYNRKNRKERQKRNKKEQRKIKRRKKSRKQLKKKQKRNNVKSNRRKQRNRHGKKYKKENNKTGRTNKQTKKEKSQKNKRKNKKNKKNKKQANKKRIQKKKKGLRRQRTSKCITRAITDQCLIDAATALNLEKGQVANFIKQVKRAMNQASIIGKKKGKKDGFSSDATHLTNALGGNASAPSCGSGDTSSSAAAAALELANCSSSITSSCAVPTVNTTLTGSGVCNTTMVNLKAKNKECKDKAGDAACTCWGEAAKMKGAVNSCSAVSVASGIKSKLKDCKKTFGNCKKKQDAAVGFSATCVKEKIKGNNNSSLTTAGMARNRKLYLQSLIRSRIRKISY